MKYHRLRLKRIVLNQSKKEETTLVPLRKPVNSYEWFHKIRKPLPLS
ncbi:hypothetical protein [Absicoccus porci]